MKNLLIAFVTALTTSVVLLKQHASLESAHNTNEQLLSQAAVLHARTVQLKDRRASLQQMLSEKQQLAEAIPQPHSEVAAPPAVIPPDPARQGGWPATTPYFYLPKKDLPCVGYPLFEGRRLTDIAATLFGMTPAERETVDAAYDNLYQKHRQLEIEQMKPADMPANRRDLSMSSPWRYFSPYLWEKASSYVAYNIPSLEAQAAALSNEFASAVEKAIGTVRASYLLPSATAYIASRVDDAGTLNDLAWNARLVAFFQVPQPNGRMNLVYGVVNNGIGSWTKTVQSPVNPDSQIAYYARLFGVDVPIKGGNLTVGTQN